MFSALLQSSLPLATGEEREVRAFVAKMVYNMDTTTSLIERLHSDKNFRRICGWERKTQIPSESTFSRAFAEFSETGLPGFVHEKMIEKTLGNEVIMHNSRDSTAIEAREKIKLKKRSATSENEKKPKTRGQTKKITANVKIIARFI